MAAGEQSPAFRAIQAEIGQETLKVILEARITAEAEIRLKAEIDQEKLAAALAKAAKDLEGQLTGLITGLVQTAVHRIEAQKVLNQTQSAGSSQ